MYIINIPICGSIFQIIYWEFWRVKEQWVHCHFGSSLNSFKTKLIIV